MSVLLSRASPLAAALAALSMIAAITFGAFDAQRDVKNRPIASQIDRLRSFSGVGAINVPGELPATYTDP